MFTLKERLEKRRNESGLALLDVMLGAAIFLLIAVISVQGSNMFRERAYQTQTLNDVRAISVMSSAYMTQPGVEPLWPMIGMSGLTGAGGSGVGGSYELITQEQLNKLGAKLTVGSQAVWAGVWSRDPTIVVCNDASAAEYYPSFEAFTAAPALPGADQDNPEIFAWGQDAGGSLKKSFFLSTGLNCEKLRDNYGFPFN